MIRVSDVAIEEHLQTLFPMGRSITGEGTRETLKYLSEIVPITIHEIPSGTEVFDWRIPEEWQVDKAWIEDADGIRWVDYSDHPLHVVNYSSAINRQVEWEELETHLYVHDALPDAIPYRTSYYKKSWGFCVSVMQREAMKTAKGPFHVVVESSHFQGSLSYGELLLPGANDREFLISSYICHPHMANDGTSGMLVTALLAKSLLEMPNRRWSYRIIFVPETIGAIAYCWKNFDAVKRLHAGLEITTVGGPGSFGLKTSWDDRHWINGLLRQALGETGAPWTEAPFDIHGADERQFSSQAFRVNVATVSKDRYYDYPEYHSSADNLDLVTPSQIAQSLRLYWTVITKLENLRFYRNLQPNCEVMLSKHGLYPEIGGAIKPVSDVKSEVSLALWLLFLLDGKTPMSSIAEKTRVPLDRLELMLGVLQEKQIVEEV